MFYPSVSATSIYEGRPLIGMGIAGIASLLPLSIFAFGGFALFGRHFPLTTVAILVVPMIAMIVVGFTYRVKCLFLGVDGTSVNVLKSANRSDLENAQVAIEEAKRAYEANQGHP